MSSSSTFHEPQWNDRYPRAQLWCSFQAPTLRRAAGLAAELRLVDGNVAQIRSQRTPMTGHREWIVTVATHEIPLARVVLRRREDELLVIQQRWPGCRFLGWKTYGIQPRRRSHKREPSWQNAA